jgi:alpha-D-ribose 1-methylphosphonate 5-triphosphate synthase subunit PhnI
MGYTSVANREEAVLAASELAVEAGGAEGPAECDLALARYPLAIDQISAEAGIVEARVCARAFAQAGGDLARAVSLVRAWSATLPRLGTTRIAAADWQPLRRITPAFVEPRGGQFLGASRDYAQRLLDFDDRPRVAAAAGASATNGSHARLEALEPGALTPAFDALASEGLVADDEALEALDITRGSASRLRRGPFLQLLARAETGALTALAYAGIRGHGQRQDPTLVELRAGRLPLRMTRPGGTVPFTIGHFVATSAEVALYAVHENGDADARFTRGFGATTGRVERRAIAAAMLDAATTRAGTAASDARAPYDDREFISLAVDGQESSGFVEHLKLPHHVTFGSDLERVRAARSAGAA